MIPVGLVYTSDFKTTAREMQKTVRLGLRKVATRWARRYLPEHFTEYAAQKYGYQERSPNYLRRKQRRHGHQNPLVWSGAMAREITSGVRTRATRTKGEAIMSGSARALNFSGKVRQVEEGRSNANQGLYIKYPDTRREITAVADDEAAELATYLDAFIGKKLRATYKNRRGL